MKNPRLRGTLWALSAFAVACFLTYVLMSTQNIFVFIAACVLCTWALVKEMNWALERKPATKNDREVMQKWLADNGYTPCTELVEKKVVCEKRYKLVGQAFVSTENKSSSSTITIYSSEAGETYPFSLENRELVLEKFYLLKFGRYAIFSEQAYPFNYTLYKKMN